MYDGKILTVILPDSEYVYGMCTNTSLVGEENFSRVEELRHQIAALRVTGGVVFYKVPAHAGMPGNEHADILAGQTADSRRCVRRELEPNTLRNALYTKDKRARLKVTVEQKHKLEVRKENLVEKKTHTHAHTHIHTHAHTYTHAHTHTYTHTVLIFRVPKNDKFCSYFLSTFLFFSPNVDREK